jgi:hypothetical protein
MLIKSRGILLFTETDNRLFNTGFNCSCSKTESHFFFLILKLESDSVCGCCFSIRILFNKLGGPVNEDGASEFKRDMLWFFTSDCRLLAIRFKSGIMRILS